MDDRRKIRNRCSSEYKKLNKEIEKKCTEAKSSWYKKNVKEIEELNMKHIL